MLPIQAANDNREGTAADAEDSAEEPEERWIAALLESEWRDGAAGRERPHAYKKWGGAHWRLVSLAELRVTATTPNAQPALDEAWAQVVGWLLGASHLGNVPLIQGRYRRCGSQEGNALWAASVMRLGTVEERGRLAGNLLRWQWPDGGWNCDRHPAAHHSSFNESLPPLRGLAAYRASEAGTIAGLDAAIDRAAEFFLRHRVVESERSGEIAHPRFVELAWPPYWHYGLLPGLRALAEVGRLGDQRVAPALDRLEAMREPDGTWRASRRYWRRGRTGTGIEVVTWGTEGESKMLTRQARTVLAAAGRAGEAPRGAPPAR
jgi:hypothetical protein